MDGLILCRGEEAAKPYYMSSLGLFVYSLEELCYAIYNNIYLLGNDFVDDDLIDFIKNDTGDVWLANELKALKARDAGLRELVITILLDVDYYTKNEVDDLRSLIDNLAALGVEERLKRRADNFLANHKYESAIKHYAAILNENNHTMKDDFYGNVLHNIAVCYSKLFLFEQAAECFKSAYGLNQSEETLKEYYMAAQLAGVKVDEEYLNEQLMNDCIAGMDELSQKIMDSEEYLEVAQIAKLRSDGNYTEYNQRMNKIFNKWKADYISVSV
jgi:tetratricopeptide (TPR) repeat protein